jgi:hypothetical protein
LGNSATRARVRRHRLLTKALDVAIGMEPVVTASDLHALARRVQAELAARGLEIADVGGQQVDDDTAHRQETTPCS